MSEAYLETETEADHATGPAAASLILAVAETLADAPDDRRYDVRLTVEETVIQDA